MKTVIIYTFSFLVILLSGCSTDKIPGVYRIDIQQGNEITQDMINQLQPGMTKNQVAYVLGTPLIIDTFQPDRWDYIYSFHPGNGEREQRRITIHFQNEQLSYLEGNTRIVPRSELPETVKMDSNVVVPLSDKKEGLIEDLKDSMGLSDDTPTEMEDKPDLFEQRPIPVPRQSDGLMDRITDTVSPSEIQPELETAPEQDKPSLLKRFIGSSNPEQVSETVPEADIQSPIPSEDEVETEVDSETSPGFFQRMKNAVGLGDESDDE